MRDPRDDLLVRVSAQRHPIENLLVQFSILSLVIMVILGVVISVILTTRLNRDFELLKEQAAATPAGANAGITPPELDTDLNYLRWTTYVAVGGGFAILYGGLVSIVWRGWRTIDSQQRDLLDAYSEVRGAYQEVRDAQDKLVRAERLAAIGELAAEVAHDLRNPLGAIKNATFYLDGKLKDSELARTNPRIPQFLQIMDEEVDSSNQIITDLMDFARVNSPNRFPTRLDSVVSDALSRNPMKESVEVVTEFEPAMEQVLADGEQLNRAFSNLFRNADDAMPDGGTITVTGRAVDGFAEVRVGDTGDGISPQDLGRVMDPLFTTKAKGIGLGLAIVNMIVDRHQGTLNVESEQGIGTTFTMKLPLDGGEQEQKDGDDGE